jgi:hypothetical protein
VRKHTEWLPWRDSLLAGKRHIERSSGRLEQILAGSVILSTFSKKLGRYCWIMNPDDPNTLTDAAMEVRQEQADEKREKLLNEAESKDVGEECETHPDNDPGGEGERMS